MAPSIAMNVKPHDFALGSTDYHNGAMVSRKSIEFLNYVKDLNSAKCGSLLSATMMLILLLHIKAIPVWMSRLNAA